jgi:hypothetical protein
MSDGDDNHFIAIDNVDQVVPERAKAFLAHSLGETLSRQRPFSDESDSVLKILLETVAKARPLFVEIGNRLCDLGFRRS